MKKIFIVYTLNYTFGKLDRKHIIIYINIHALYRVFVLVARNSILPTSRGTNKYIEGLKSVIESIP